MDDQKCNLVHTTPQCREGPHHSKVDHATIFHQNAELERYGYQVTYKRGLVACENW